MNIRNLSKFSIYTFALLFFFASCVKEGPMGLQGEPGADGADGTDANETCKLCHNPAVTEKIMAEYKFSKHHYGEAAFEEAGRAACAPCHAAEGFKYVVANNISNTFVKNPTTGKYTDPFSATNATAYGEFNCFTCHKNLHTTYKPADFFPLTTVAPVPLAMWGGTKTATIAVNGGESHLCVKCHQPRTLTQASDGNVVDFADLVKNPTAKFYDPAAGVSILRPSYRTGVHYGTVGAIYAGVGGVEFTGPMGYANMVHKDKASCQDCHMAPMNGRAGGHTFFAQGNFNGCNTTACHGTGTVTATNAKYWTNPRAEIKKLLDDLGAKLNINGVEIMSRNPDAEHNLWAGMTTNKYDGYLNLYDPLTNPEGPEYNASLFQNPAPSSSWSQAQKDINATLPKLTLTKAQMGAIINFQLCLRDYSLGIHNFNYAKALLTNSIAVLN